MKVLTLYPGKRRGGAFQRFSRTVKALASRGHEVFYFSMDPLPFSEENVRYVKFNSPFSNVTLSQGWFIFLSILRTPGLLRTHRLDVCVAFAPAEAACFILGKLLNRTKIILFLHGNSFIFGKQSGYSKIKDLIFRALCVMGLKNTDRFVLVSSALKKLYERYLKGKQVEVVYNDIESTIIPAADKIKIRAEHGIPANDIVLGFVGRVTSIKNVSMLLEAYRRLVSDGEFSNVWLLFLGDGPLLPEMVKVAKSNALEKVMFLGWVEHPLRYYGLFDLLVLPSVYEACPLAVLEAIGCGIPALVSCEGGGPELVGKSDLTFNPASDKELLDKLKHWSRNSDYRNEICAYIAGRRENFVFDWDSKVVEQIETFTRA